ncbi:ABC-type branched-chain amino acid transport system, substrate-binding protein [Sphingobacterium wenxiniae]|uniref:ABC-type branched-chain amino acid transport system, substrate-binding protein n=2 Tax=Sphingobacterium wenxiniae TaxID=683125 RepID=A0A1I6Q1X1_9SPHI|nr:ABC-type branched-chain amino acid transport system, substrate-binding protein [Sphingobacterium wenxiniae]
MTIKTAGIFNPIKKDISYRPASTKKTTITTPIHHIYKMTIAVLLPSSTTHKQLGYDFYLSLQYALEQEHKDIEWMSSSIGFGTDEVDMLAKAEDMLLNRGADLLIAFADYPKLSVVFPLLEAVNKQLLLVNMGAKLPVDWRPHPQVFHLNLQESLLAHIAGKTLYQEGNPEFVLATNYYEGGYAPCQLAVDAYMQQGGTVGYNFIPHTKGETFSIEPLTTYLAESETKPAIYANYSHPLTTVFWEQWQKSAAAQENILWCSSILLMEILATDPDTLLNSKHITGLVAWHHALDNVENTTFVQQFQQKLNRPGNHFGALGWDAGLLITHALQAYQARQPFELVAALTNSASPIKLSRGEAVVDKDFQMLIAPAYRLSVVDRQLHYHVLDAAELLAAWQELKQQHPQPNQNGWFNTYLCS